MIQLQAQVLESFTLGPTAGDSQFNVAEKINSVTMDFEGDAIERLERFLNNGEPVITSGLLLTIQDFPVAVYDWGQIEISSFLLAKIAVQKISTRLPDSPQWLELRVDPFPADQNPSIVEFRGNERRMLNELRSLLLNVRTRDGEVTALTGRSLKSRIQIFPPCNAPLFDAADEVLRRVEALLQL